jgi:hypothetical protein
MEKHSTHIRCAFCGWKALKFRKLKSGKTRGPDAAFQMLFNHAAAHHPEQFDKAFPDRFEEE